MSFVQMGESDEEAWDQNEQIRNAFHRWEQTGKAWDRLIEHEGHLTDATVTGPQWESESSRRRHGLLGSVRGLIRSFVIVVDLSPKGLAPTYRDFGQPRIRLITQQLRNFCASFLDQNPLSQLAIVTTYDSRGHVQSPLSGDLDKHLSAIDAMSDLGATGECSLANSIQVAVKLFGATNRYSTREILLIVGSFTSCDSRPLEQTITLLTNRQSSAVVSAIGFCARASGLEQITAATGGIYRVPTSIEQIEDLLRTHIHPPAWSEQTQRVQLVPFGFGRSSEEKQSFDSNELKRDFKGALPKVTNMACPKCEAPITKVPSYCPCCGLLLMGPAHLTRSLHHLRPLEDFEAVETLSAQCAACNGVFVEGAGVVCVKCQSLFCRDCDRFLHECLQNCPGCLQKGV
jgi:transcription initiation factor TFIIH subunit 2